MATSQSRTTKACAKSAAARKQNGYGGRAVYGIWRGKPTRALLSIIEKEDPSISTYAAAAAYWGLPVWAMMVPGTTRDMFEDKTKIARLVQLVSDYLDSSDTQRSNIDSMAAGLAEINRGRAAEVAHG